MNENEVNCRKFISIFFRKTKSIILLSAIQVAKTSTIKTIAGIEPPGNVALHHVIFLYVNPFYSDSLHVVVTTT